MRSGPGKSLAFSEFNLISGPMTPFNSMFTNASAMLLGGVLQSVLQASSVNEPNLEFATLYLFNYPATHRMFKSLVYGDLDVLDAAGLDQGFSSGLPEMAPTLEMSAIRTPDRLYVNIVNPGPGTNKDVEIDLELQPKNYRFAVVRETSEYKRDEVVAVTPVKDKKVKVEIPCNSLTQLILVDLGLDKIQNLGLEEKSLTPGTLAQLSKFQTTRLKAYGEIEGKKPRRKSPHQSRSPKKRELTRKGWSRRKTK